MQGGDVHVQYCVPIVVTIMAIMAQVDVACGRVASDCCLVASDS
jgi:hypothetical protein